ncbi:MAG: gamma-glutamyl-gamma-aminobutyrate hydrolase family protein [Pedosphaera sp.]|nr:gamma-glutamyl-gamma-aminobutyrate hydrolase family protein [Pedosphaera sp.]
MTGRPLILVAPSTQKRGIEFADHSVSLSNYYCRAIIAGGGLPVITPLTERTRIIAASVARCDGVMLTGGDDLQPDLYDAQLPEALRKKVVGTDPLRDLFEMELIDQSLRQGKPLLAICRGHQALNVALGGTLITDIPTEAAGAMEHRRQDASTDTVQEIRIDPETIMRHIFATDRLRVNSAHHQAVGRIANPLRATARTDDGLVEAIELKPEEAGVSPFLLGVQFHPERLFEKHAEFLKMFKAFVDAAAATNTQR